MTLPNHIATRLSSIGIPTESRRDGIYVTVDGREVKVRLDEEWQQAFDVYRRARSSSYDATDWSHSLNNSFEFPLARLDDDLYRDADEPTFEDAVGNRVAISRASMNYSLAHFDSADYARYFESLVKTRLTRTPTTVGKVITSLFRRPTTVTYTARGRRTPPNLKEIALERIRSCLFKLAVERHACYEISKPKAQRSIFKLDLPSESDWQIPAVRYDPNIVSYYKVARSSPFPSQSYLAYYHVLEYYFLRVAEDSLHHQLKTLLHRPDFRSHPDGLDRVISLVRKQASQDDETEMLRKVLQRFAAEDDFIAFVGRLEVECEEKLYTKRRPIFGETLEISMKEGHAISNAAKVMKHIRNAIVHSSDKYKRDECHIPLTETENTIEEFIPIVKYFAEQVIYGTGMPTEF